VAFFNFDATEGQTPEIVPSKGATLRSPVSKASALPSAGARINDSLRLEVLRDSVTWATLSSPAAPEGQATYNQRVRDGVVDITSIVNSIDKNVVAAG